jgi:hypothetical protein
MGSGADGKRNESNSNGCAGFFRTNSHSTDEDDDGNAKIVEGAGGAGPSVPTGLATSEGDIPSGAESPPIWTIVEFDNGKRLGDSVALRTVMGGSASLAWADGDERKASSEKRDAIPSEWEARIGTPNETDASMSAAAPCCGRSGSGGTGDWRGWLEAAGIGPSKNMPCTARDSDFCVRDGVSCLAKRTRISALLSSLASSASLELLSASDEASEESSVIELNEAERPT